MKVQPFMPFNIYGGMPMPNNGSNNNNNNPMINNFMAMPPMYNNFDFYGNMGINNSMNMNMYNLMMNYLSLYYSTMHNNMSNSNDNKIITKKPSSKMIPVYSPIPNSNNNNNKRNLYQTVRNKSPSFLDIFPEIQENKMNVFFQTPEGNKINVLVPATAKMKDVLVKFVSKIGLSENDIDNTIIFIYSARKIKKNEKKTLIEMGILNGAIIITMDKSGVSGA